MLQPDRFRVEVPSHEFTLKDIQAINVTTFWELNTATIGLIWMDRYS